MGPAMKGGREAAEVHHLAPVDLTTARAERTNQVVSVLEEMLHRARAGEFSEVLVVADVAQDGDVLHCWSGSPDLYRIAGKIARLQHSILRRMDG